MIAKTLMTVVLKTVTVTSVKLATTADRIGQGLRSSNAYPMDNLSAGQNPLPPNPEPEQVRVRQLSSTHMRKQMRAGDGAVPPASSVGCPSSPGFTAVRFAFLSALSLTGWQRATQTAATGRTHKVCLFADPSRANFPGNPGHDDRFGSDCQSPDRNSDKQIAIRGVSSAAIAKK
ncbi:MAG TPA: hypothetical protein VG122_15925 [Gemmata sp.]|jgi:hypothetical protein|nr:hypothetical protein [Gemmata sp.]